MLQWEWASAKMTSRQSRKNESLLQALSQMFLGCLGKARLQS
jgi:hypothetical protein